jgi:copper transporter 1
MTFGVAYILMLLAMSYNGYIIISILLGIGVGHYLLDKPVVSSDCEVESKRGGDEGLMTCCG